MITYNKNSRQETNKKKENQVEKRLKTRKITKKWKMVCMKSRVDICYLCSNYGIVDLKKTKADLEAMKKQAESTSAEYNRLAEEHQKLLVC